MSSSAPEPPDLERVEKGFKAVTSLTNTLIEFLRWVAGMIRKRQWVELLMFFIAVAIVFWSTKFTLAQFIPEPIFCLIWGILAVIFFAGVILELLKKPPLRIIARNLGKRTAIKFLSSFEQEDAEVFAHLQGYRIDNISESIAYPEFSFGILKGKSGCGKSSYLKAGILAKLAKTEAYRGVYIKFSNLDSLATIREAFVESLKLPKQDIETFNFIDLLNKGVEAASQNCPNFKSLILIFDQFEQFFVYTDDEARRQTFIQDLALWYNSNDLKGKVKILVSIREDWFARMDEIQKALNYTLKIGGQSGGNSFYLKNFSAEEATIILTVMAQEDLGIGKDDNERFDRSYIEDILERELASPVDHLISPVDLQIIAETIKQQNTSEMRAFNRTALQRLGGIEGLRLSFLENILEPLGAERQKSAVQVLIALTNLEQQTRAEVQTLAQLQEKVKGTMPAQEVEKIADYLQQGTGLIAVVERDGVKGYELSHERMIDAVIRLGNQVQEKVYRTNQLMERRVNEWLGNNRSPRYLFNLKELWSIERQMPCLVWGKKGPEKKKLIAQSKQRIYQIFGGVGCLLLLGMVGCGWSNYTTPGQLTRIRWRLADLSQQNIDSNHRFMAVEAFAKDENFAQAIAVANQIQGSSSKAKSLSAIAKAYGNLNQPEKAVLLLEEAIAAAKQIQDSSDKASALSVIAEAIGKFKPPEKAASLIEEALTATNQIQESSFRVYALSAMAQAYGELNQPQKAVPLLKEALTATNQIQELFDKARALRAIVKATGKLNQLEKAAPLLEEAIEAAKQIQDSSYKAWALSAMGQAYGNLNQTEKATSLIEEAIAAANPFQGSYGTVRALSGIAQAIGKLDQPEKAVPLLEKAIAANNQLLGSRDGKALRAIAQTIGKLNQPSKTASLLEKEIAAANQIQESSYKAWALIVIAQAYGKLNQLEKATPLLEKAIAIADQIQESSDKVYALSADVYTLSSIAQAYSELNQPEKAAPLLKKAITAANQIQESSNKAQALRVIAEVDANLKSWGPALEVVQQCTSKDCEVESLAKILTIYAEQQHPELKEEKEEEGNF
jgi:tetratricopeptide (TPR) repeat protein